MAMRLEYVSFVSKQEFVHIARQLFLKRLFVGLPDLVFTFSAPASRERSPPPRCVFTSSQARCSSPETVPPSFTSCSPTWCNQFSSSAAYSARIWLSRSRNRRAVLSFRCLAISTRPHCPSCSTLINARSTSLVSGVFSASAITCPLVGWASFPCCWLR